MIFARWGKFPHEVLSLPRIEKLFTYATLELVLEEEAKAK